MPEFIKYKDPETKKIVYVNVMDVCEARYDASDGDRLELTFGTFRGKGQVSVFLNGEDARLAKAKLDKMAAE